MTIYKRTKNIISAKVHQGLVNYQNPELEIEEIVNSMKSAISELEKYAAATLAEKMLIKKQIEVMEGNQAKWLDKAKRAVGAGQDDLARRALLQKKSIEHDIKSCYDFLLKINENFLYLKAEIKKNRKKYEELKSKISLAKHKNLMNKLGMGNKSIKEEEDSILELKFDNLRKLSNKKNGIDEEISKLKSKLK